MIAGYENKADANDWLYWFDSSYDYDPSPDLEKITAKVLAVNFADDELNPPQLDVMNAALARVKDGRFVLVPTSPLPAALRPLRRALLLRRRLGLSHEFGEVALPQARDHPSERVTGRRDTAASLSEPVAPAAACTFLQKSREP
jgi:homoserine O-acetyltransferase